MVDEVTIIGTPNLRGLEMLYEAVSKWLEAGMPCYQCQQCFEPLTTEEEREAHFCKKHLTTRKVYTYEDALASVARSQARRARRLAKEAKHVS